MMVPEDFLTRTNDEICRTFCRTDLPRRLARALADILMWTPELAFTYRLAMSSLCGNSSRSLPEGSTPQGRPGTFKCLAAEARVPCHPRNVTYAKNSGDHTSNVNLWSVRLRLSAPRWSLEGQGAVRRPSCGQESGDR